MSSSDDDDRKCSEPDFLYVINLLRSLLGDLHYGSRDIKEYLKRNGVCPDCYERLNVGDACASCISDEEENDDPRE